MQITYGTLTINCDSAIRGKHYIKWYIDGHLGGMMSGIANTDDMQVIDGEWNEEPPSDAQRISDLEAAIAELAFGGGGQ